MSQNQILNNLRAIESRSCCRSVAVSTKVILRNLEAASGNWVTLPLATLGCMGGSGCPCARCQDDDDEEEAVVVTAGEGAVAEEFTLVEGSTAKFLSRSMAGFGSTQVEATASLGESTSTDSGFGISGAVRGSA